MTEVEGPTAIAIRLHTDPWHDFDGWFSDVHDRLWSSFGFVPFAAPERAPAAPTGLQAARTDIQDTGKAFRVSAEIPGVPKEKLEVHVRGSNVEIRGEHANGAAEEKNGFVRRERTYSGFYRAFELPEPVVGTKATAKIQDGVLVLELPKEKPSAEPDDVRVQVQ
ncbi:MAG TPA: Hsp20/alpha crystallin family protein [Thermoplasmata archaeon]|nr:Hsp20/alpha crystallin family protein [Thermoplasmata archaeon]